MRTFTNHFILLVGVLVMIAPILLMFFASTESSANLRADGMQMKFGQHIIENYNTILSYKSGFIDEVTPLAMLINSLIVAVGVALLTTILSFLTAYSVVYFYFKLATGVFSEPLRVHHARFRLPKPAQLYYNMHPLKLQPQKRLLSF